MAGDTPLKGIVLVGDGFNGEEVERLAESGFVIERVESVEDVLRKSEEALRESEALYRQVVQNTTAVILRIGPDGIIRFANDRALEFFGYAAEELIGKHATGTIVPETETTGRDLAAMVDQIVRSPDDFHSNVNENMRKGGERVWLEWTNSGIYDSEGRLVELLSVGIDITERRMAEKALRQSEARYRMLHETMRDAFVQVDMEGRLIEFNDVYCEMLGYSAEELRELTYQDLTPERWHISEADIVREQIIPRGYSDVYEKEYRRKDGTIVPIEIRTILSRDANGQPESMWGIVRDATERKKAEETLRESEERYRSLFEHMLDGFAYCQMLFDEHGRPDDFIYLAVNDAFGRLTGLTNVIGRRVTEVIPGIKELNPELLDTYGRVASTGDPERFEIDFKPLGLYLSVSVYSPANGSFVAVFDNVTERKLAEEALRESEERLKSLAENIPSVLMRFDRQFRAVYLSPRSDDYNSVPASEIIGKSNREIGMPPHLCDLWDSAMETVFQTGKPTDVEFELETQDGARTFLLRLAPEYRADGEQVEYVLGVSTDITERKLAEEALTIAKADAERRAAELQSFFSNMTDGFVLHDAGGNPILWNQAAQDILGTAPVGSVEERVERLHVRKLDGSLMNAEETASGRALRGETVKESRYKVITPDAEKVVSVSSSPVRAPDGRLLGATTVFRDVTDQEEFERRREDLYRREHRISEMLQQALIPVQIPSTVAGCQFAARYIPALDEAIVGGDFYDVFDLGDGKVAVLIGDVAGKGVLAAMQVSAARYAFRSYAYTTSSPSEVVYLVNEALCKSDDASLGNMLTAFFAIVDTEGRTVTYTNAGHEPPVIRRADGGLNELVVGARALGVLPDCGYPEDRLTLDAGDLIVLVTDGITEARSADHGMFGKSGMLDFLAEAHVSPSELVDRLLEKARHHGNGSLQDDVAIVAFGLESSCVEVVSNG